MESDTRLAQGSQRERSRSEFRTVIVPWVSGRTAVEGASRPETAPPVADDQNSVLTQEVQSATRVFPSDVDEEGFVRGYN